VVALTPKAFAVLRRLVEGGGRLVTKAELLRAGWADTHVTDGVIKVSILEIRRALGDDSSAPRFIETVPRRGYRLIAPRSRTSRAVAREDPAHEPVGRAGLLAELDARLERARRGKRQLVFLTGEAGIGKTTVLDAFVARVAADPDVMIAHGACLEHYGGAEAYLPVLEALGRLLREPGSDGTIRLLERYAPTWVVQLPWVLRRDERETLRRDLLGVTKERMLREMAEALEVLTAEMPLVLVLEDLHWSDDSTLDLLRMLGRREEPARLLVLGSYRPVDVIIAGHPLRAVTQELRIRRQGEELALAFLREADVAAHLAQRFGEQVFLPELAATVHRRTDGNPLFMVRVVDELVALGVIAEEQGGWRLVKPLAETAGAVPETLRQLIENQIARLKPEAQRLLEAGSVLGSEFTVASVAAGLDTDPVAVEELCDELARRGQFLARSPVFTRPDGTTVARYRFAHSLYPQALVERVSAGRRVRLHQRLGEWLEQTYGAHAGVIETQMAHHFEEARDYRRAIAHLRRAAEHDLRRWAYQEAVARLEHAVVLAGRLSPTDADAVYPLLLDQLALVRRVLDDVPGGLRIVDALSAWARERGDVAWEGRAALRRASVLYWTDPDASQAASIDALKLAERAGDELLRAHAQSHAAYWQLHLHGCRVEDIRLAEEAVTAAAAAGDREVLLYTMAILALLRSARSEYRTATRTAVDGIEIARDAGDAYMYLWLLYVQIEALVRLGEWGAALVAIDSGLQVATQIGNLDVVSLFGSHAAFLHTRAYDFAGAAALARNALRRESLTAGARQNVSFELAFAHLGLGELDEAQALFTAPDLAWSPEVGAMPFSAQLRLREGRAQVCLARGDVERARREANTLQALATSADEPAPRARAAWLLGEIALQEGQLSKAETFLREALAAIEEREMPLVEWHIAAAAARLYKRQRRTRMAETARARSAALITRLADSLPAGHELRRSFLTARAVREVLGPRHAARDRSSA
jgi:tetratricopeptide (TPR) repeat protein